MPVKSRNTPLSRAFLNFTEEETATLVQMHADLYSISEIAAKLQKTAGAIQQKIFRLGLPPRDHNLIRMINHYGRGVLRYGRDTEAIKRGMAEDRKERMENKRRMQQAALNRLKRDLMHNVDRNTAIIDAFKGGASQSQIGAVAGMTKQNVSLIINPPKKVPQ